MKYSDKQILFDDFLKEWRFKFNNIPFILNYISSYPELIAQLKDFHPLTIEEISESQLEWVALIAQFDNPIEKEFFKAFWVPIQRDAYEYFIDLSSHAFSIFKIEFFFFEPYHWYKKFIFKDIRDFLISVDDQSINLEEQIIRNETERLHIVSSFFSERDELGFAGKIREIPIDKDCLFEEEKEKESTYVLQNETLVINCINSIVIGLIPFDKEIILINFDAYTNGLNYNRYNNINAKVKNIKALTYLIRSVGLIRVRNFLLFFRQDIDCYAEFKNNIFKLRHYDKSLLNELINKYEQIKKS